MGVEPPWFSARFGAIGVPRPSPYVSLHNDMQAPAVACCQLLSYRSATSDAVQSVVHPNKQATALRRRLCLIPSIGGQRRRPMPGAAAARRRPLRTFRQVSCACPGGCLCCDELSQSPVCQLLYSWLHKWLRTPLTEGLPVADGSLTWCTALEQRFSLSDVPHAQRQHILPPAGLPASRAASGQAPMMHRVGLACRVGQRRLRPCRASRRHRRSCSTAPARLVEPGHSSGGRSDRCQRCSGRGQRSAAPAHEWVVVPGTPERRSRC